MTTIKKHLANDNGKPTATVILDFTQREKLVEVKLEGIILGNHVEALRDFLKNVTYFPGNQWTLQLEDLEVISLRGLRTLQKYANVIRQRGYKVEIKSIQPLLLANFLERKVCEHFAWKMEKITVVPNASVIYHGDTGRIPTPNPYSSSDLASVSTT